MSPETNAGGKELKGSPEPMRFDRSEMIRTAGYLGAAMLVSGLLRYSIQGVIQTFSEILMIAGGVLVLVAIVLNFRLIIGFFTRRSSKLGTNAAVITLAVLAILGLVNFLGERHHKRFDLTTEKLFTLSDQTRNIVKGVKQDVKIIRFDKQKDPEVDDRVAEYVSLNRHISYQNVDPAGTSRGCQGIRSRARGPGDRVQRKPQGAAGGDQRRRFHRRHFEGDQRQSEYGVLRGRPRRKIAERSRAIRLQKRGR